MRSVTGRTFKPLLLIGPLAVPLSAQVAPAPPSDVPPPQQRWNLFYQATSIASTHGPFRSPYSGPFSLQSRREADVSLTTTLFFGLRLARYTQLDVDPEIAGGRGFSGVNGLAHQYNGELPRFGSATPKPYLARGFITQDFKLGDEMENFRSDENQLAGSRPIKRYTVTIGRFTITDYFDNNRYSHDPRTQFTGWAVMYNGAWDYPADTRGYTWGWVHELHMKNWSVRYGSVAEPRTANGPRFDRRVFRDRGDVVQSGLRYSVNPHPGRSAGSWLPESRECR
jgi:high affinity Mn2+ porin